MRAVGLINHSDRREPGWIQLMSAIFAQAVADAKAADLPQALDACLWLTGGDAPLYLDAIGVGEYDPVTLLTSGQARAAKTGRWVGAHG